MPLYFLMATESISTVSTSTTDSLQRITACQITVDKKNKHLLFARLLIFCRESYSKPRPCEALVIGFQVRVLGSWDTVFFSS